MGETKTFKTDQLTFILSPKKILVVTSLGQSFYLSPKTHYWNRRMLMIRAMIELNEVRDLNELADWCAKGNVEWITTTRKIEIENLDPVMV